MYLSNDEFAPMKRVNYDYKLQNLWRRFDWLGDRTLAVAPGHITPLRQVLPLIEHTLTARELAGLRFVRIFSAVNGGLTVDMGPVRAPKRAKLQTIGWMAHDLSLAVCEVCSKPLRGSGSSYRCAVHAGSQAWFAEEFEALAKVAAPRAASSGERAVDAPHHDADSGTAPAEAAAAPLADDGRPRVTLFDPKLLEHYLGSQRQRRSEHQSAARAIEARLIAAGGHTRALGMLPSDWDLLLQRFEQGFPNFAELAALLRDYFSLSALGDGRVAWPPVLLVGPPGVGKTEAARWVSEAFGLPFRVFDMASAQSGSILSGSEAFWSNSAPGRLFELLGYEPVANPVVLLDELDKVSDQHRYDPCASLYTLLEPSSARTFRDLSLDLPMDASHVNWIGTANDLRAIAEPIRSRMTVLEVSAPSPIQTMHIVHSIYGRLREQAPWGSAFVEHLDDAVAERLAGLAPRTLSMCLRRAMGAAARHGRTALCPDDVLLPALAPQSRSIGFMAERVA